MANLLDSKDIQCAGFDHDYYQEAACAHHEEHVMHDCVQLDHVVDSHNDYTSDSNIIQCDQYVRDNEVPIIHSGASSVPTDAFMMIYDDMCEPHDQSVSYPSRNTVVKNSLTAELAIYKEHVELPRPNSNEQKRVAIGYKNPLCLTRAKQVQPALYNGHEIIKDKHTPAIVHNSEDTLEIAEITRMKMNDKMNDPECVIHNVKIAPHDYSKENLLATFTPQKQLTPETNLLRITPSAITDGERGFEKTKACYLQEVIPFFKTLKENFEGIQKALTKEVKEMKDMFEELEAEVAQYAVDRKHDAIELKNLLIANDNLIAVCLSQEVFCVATNSELNVARFTEMLAANTTAETRCQALKAELANLRETNNQDNQKELINHFSKLKVSHLNLQLKYQNLKDKIGNSPPTPDNDTPDFDSVFVIGKMQASLQGKDNVIHQLKKQLSQLQVTRRDTDRALQVRTTDSQIISARDKHAIDVEPIVPRLRNNRNAHLDYLRHLKESVEIIRDIIEEAKVLAHIPLIRKKQVIVAQPSNKLDSTTYLHVVTVTSQKTNVLVPPSTGVNCCPIASGSQPKSHVKPNRISPAKVNCGGLRYKFLNIVTINVAIGGWTISARMSTTASNTTFLGCFYGSRRLILTF
nr:integrase, catalytic region, zinc finger, CCHC-type, peptidase aspartic, catalytic [Tanacetum cinerariifolium]